MSELDHRLELITRAEVIFDEMMTTDSVVRKVELQSQMFKVIAALRESIEAEVMRNE